MTDGFSTRTEMLLGEGGVRRLAESTVVVIGAGAVGGYVLEGLVRAGVGHIRVVDKDVFSASNINRQILATVDTIGRKKSEVAIERARSINPQVDISTIDTLVSEDTIPEILCDVPDVLIDAIDTVAHKISLLRYAAEKGIVTFSSMGAALHVDVRAIRVAPLKRTNVCPLAARIRSGLRGLDTSRITCVYSEEKSPVDPDDRDEYGKGILGSLPTIPAIFGMMLANEAILYIARG